MRLLFALALVVLALLLAAWLFWVRPIWAATTRCATDQEQTLGRLQTLCTDGTRATSSWNRTLERWDTTITESPKNACTRQLNPKTRQVKVKCREEDHS